MSATTMPETRTYAAEVEDRCRVYEREFGFDTVVVLGAVHLMTGSVSGVIVAPELGRMVTAGLSEVPVFSVDHHGHRMWVLLADVASPAVDIERMTLRLFAVGAIPVFPRATVVLPSPGDPRRVWLHPPQGRTRPSLATVVDAIADAAVHGARRCG
ncbi:hypothetical protein [Nocardia macrotermitis]|uniref:Uncharacterized protein n=1 Tax=Nocardia macrotermitis TaxID=2585198 RepID=A0A7K0DFM7_9NOCA|nr:hypothetical protein [Nocardia macrotermitis]MQY24341.1 hypothetical protein [Nocardia macrotermitis]